MRLHTRVRIPPQPRVFYAGVFIVLFRLTVLNGSQLLSCINLKGRRVSVLDAASSDIPYLLA